MLFHDGQSSTLSSMAESAGKIEFKVWIKLGKTLNREHFESNFDIEVQNPKICDGGYEDELVVTKMPVKPKECLRVPKKDLADNYQKPTNNQQQASLLIEAEYGVIGRVENSHTLIYKI